VTLEVANLAETPDGLRVTIRRSKTDQEEGRAGGYEARPAPRRAWRSGGGSPHKTLASETIIADSAGCTLVVDRRSAVGTSLPQAASKRALPVKTRQ
jgi:hypothetical protein